MFQSKPSIKDGSKTTPLPPWIISEQFLLRIATPGHPQSVTSPLPNFFFDVERAKLLKQESVCGETFAVMAMSNVYSIVWMQIKERTRRNKLIKKLFSSSRYY